jgi:hypothetical protein
MWKTNALNKVREKNAMWKECSRKKEQEVQKLWAGLWLELGSNRTKTMWLKPHKQRLKLTGDEAKEVTR